MDRALSYLGLARRGGNLQIGDELVQAAIRAGRARLVIVAKDAGEHTLRRAQNLGQSWNVPVTTGPWSKLDLGLAFGTRSCALAALTEPRLALAFLQAMDSPPDESVMQRVQAMADRAARHQQEIRTHEKNVRHGSAPQRKRTK